MDNKIGFIGGGNMARAIIAGLIKAGLYQPEKVIVYDNSLAALNQLRSDFGIEAAVDTAAVVQAAQVIILAVKPQTLPAVLAEWGSKIAKDKLVISIAAGITLENLSAWLSAEHKLVRVMPNTPALVGEGMSGICVSERLSEPEKQQVYDIFSSFGKAEFVTEKLMDAVVGVSGSAPAYVYLFIEALADGAVLEGMPRNQAYAFAAQTVLGSAKMVMDSKKHPGELKDMVCSPGGTTIEAVKSLEQNAFRAAVIEAVQTAAGKNRGMKI